MSDKILTDYMGELLNGSEKTQEKKPKLEEVEYTEKQLEEYALEVEKDWERARRDCADM